MIQRVAATILSSDFLHFDSIKNRLLLLVPSLVGIPHADSAKRITKRNPNGTALQTQPWAKSRLLRDSGAVLNVSIED